MTLTTAPPATTTPVRPTRHPHLPGLPVTGEPTPAASFVVTPYIAGGRFTGGWVLTHTASGLTVPGTQGVSLAYSREAGARLASLPPDASPDGSGIRDNPAARRAIWRIAEDLESARRRGLPLWWARTSLTATWIHGHRLWRLRCAAPLCAANAGTPAWLSEPHGPAWLSGPSSYAVRTTDPATLGSYAREAGWTCTTEILDDGDPEHRWMCPSCVTAHHADVHAGIQRLARPPAGQRMVPVTVRTPTGDGVMATAGEPTATPGYAITPHLDARRGAYTGGWHVTHAATGLPVPGLQELPLVYAREAAARLRDVPADWSPAGPADRDTTRALDTLAQDLADARTEQRPLTWARHCVTTRAALDTTGRPLPGWVLQCGAPDCTDSDGDDSGPALLRWPVSGDTVVVPDRPQLWQDGQAAGWTHGTPDTWGDPDRWLCPACTTTYRTARSIG